MACVGANLDRGYTFPGGEEAKMMDDKLPREYAELADTLRRLRTMMGMDVVFVSEFVDDKRTFRYVDARSADCPLKAGDAGPYGPVALSANATRRLRRSGKKVSSFITST